MPHGVRRTNGDLVRLFVGISGSNRWSGPGPRSPTGATPPDLGPGPDQDPAQLVNLERRVLDLGVFLHRGDRHVLAVAGLLVAAVRHRARDREQMVVDPDGPALKPLRAVQRTADVTRPHGRREAVRDVVR